MMDQLLPTNGTDLHSSVPKADIPCLVCRSRKVRCDRSMPECHNCVRLGITCPRYEAGSQQIPRSEIQKSTEDIFKAAGVEKRRVGSCEECRTSKHRCTRTRPSCRRCIIKKLYCLYPDKQESSRARSSLSESVQDTKIEFNPQDHIDLQLEHERFFSETLPDDPGMRLKLVNAFFDRSHPLRCLSFIHRPSFMHSLDRDSIYQDYGEPLLLIMCALGARHLYLDEVSSLTLRDSDRTPAGKAWADKARMEVLAEMDRPTVQHLMTMVLLCDYGLRTDQNSMVFILVAFLYRLIRLLGLDDPRPLPDNATPAMMIERESEHRVVWACFFIDLFMSTAGPKNMNWREHMPNIPLPRADISFLVPPSPRFYLSAIDDSGVAPVIQDLDISALAVLVMRLRIAGLHLIRTRPEDLSTSIWDPASAFILILERLDAVYQNLPEKYHLTDANILDVKGKNILGGVFFLHFLIHAVAFDLTRISLPGFFFPLASAFQSAEPWFLSCCRDRCRFHAVQATNLIRRGLSHGRVPFDDIFTADAALEAAKIQIIYTATVNQSPDVIEETRENVDLTLRFFQQFNFGQSGPSQYIRTLMPICFLFGFRDVAEPYRDITSVSEGDDPAEVTAPADVEHLSRFAPLRRARSAIHEAKSSGGSGAGSSHRSYTSTTHSSLRPPPVAPSQQPPLSASSSNIVNSAQNYGPSPAPIPSQATAPPQPFATLQLGSDQILPNLRPDYMLPVSETLPLEQSDTFQHMPVMGATMMDGIPQPSVDDYIRTADEMSGYLTWQAMTVPSWLNFDNMFPPG